MGRAGLPLVQELRPVPDVELALRAFSDVAGVLLLESTLRHDKLGRYSFLTAGPLRFFQQGRVDYGSDPLEPIRRSLEAYRSSTVPGLPPFQGGTAGYLSYELGGAWENVSAAPWNEFKLPVLAVGLYDWVLAWDHATDEAWILAHGLDADTPEARTDAAARRVKWVQGRLERLGSHPKANAVHTDKASEKSGAVLRADQLAPQFPVEGQRLISGIPSLTSNFRRDDYLRAVDRVIEYIYAGDIFQANVSQRLLAPACQDRLDLYGRLRRRNRSTFAAYFAHDDWSLLSASPERFVCLRGGELETRPIKGTRRREPVPEADLFTRDELRESEKDQSENVMIVDLLRNDLSKVCQPASIRVPALCNVETYETVQHLVSEVRGRLNVGHDAWDVLQALFPGGSITGAPKVRAMEIIAELEPTVRGPYCGTLFYVGFDGAMDSSILIRTFVQRSGWIQCAVGGGIVAQSTPADEYEETLHKADGMLRALAQ